MTRFRFVFVDRTLVCLKLTLIPPFVLFLFTLGQRSIFLRGRRGRDRMVVGFTYAISAYHH
jgi:type IV secretory pathway TrbL component